MSDYKIEFVLLTLKKYIEKDINLNRKLQNLMLKCCMYFKLEVITKVAQIKKYLLMYDCFIY